MRQQKKKQSKSEKDRELLLLSYFRERERKLMARNAALQTSTEELGRKLQLKVNTVFQ